MLTVVLICITAIAVFQVGVLIFCWWHRKDPLLLLPREQRAEVLIRLIRAGSNLSAIRVFAQAILSQSYGTLNLSQAEFTHQMLEHCEAARRTLTELLDPSQPLASGGADKGVSALLAKVPEKNTIVSYLEQKQNIPHPQASL